MIYIENMTQRYNFFLIQTRKTHFFLQNNLENIKILEVVLLFPTFSSNVGTHGSCVRQSSPTYCPPVLGGRKLRVSEAESSSLELC